MDNYLKLSESTSGFTNQKLNILGLIIESHRTKSIPLLPSEIYDFVPRPNKLESPKRKVKMSDLFDINLLSKVCQINDKLYNRSYIKSFKGFREGAIGFKSEDTQIKDWLSHIVPSDNVKKESIRVISKLPPIYDCVQFRVENDFQLYRHQKILDGEWTEETAPPIEPTKIFDRIDSENPLYLCCQENDLSFTKKQLRERVNRDLIFRSDIIDGVYNSNLYAASIDAEIIFNSNSYYGLTRSTLSLMSIYNRKMYTKNNNYFYDLGKENASKL